MPTILVRSGSVRLSRFKSLLNFNPDMMLLPRIAVNRREVTAQALKARVNRLDTYGNITTTALARANLFIRSTLANTSFSVQVALTVISVTALIWARTINSFFSGSVLNSACKESLLVSH